MVLRQQNVSVFLAQREDTKHRTLQNSKNVFFLVFLVFNWQTYMTRCSTLFGKNIISVPAATHYLNLFERQTCIGAQMLLAKINAGKFVML